jgi:hypothetical protein
MKYYLLLWLAVLLGQFFVSTITVWIDQRNNPKIDYMQALKVYYRKEVGTYLVIFSFTLLLTFILSDWMDLSATRQELMTIAERNKFEEAQIRFRTYATCYGVFAQLIALFFFKGGRNAVKQFGQDKGIDLN